MASVVGEAAIGTVVEGTLGKPLEKLIEVLEFICCYGSKVASLQDETEGLEKKVADVKGLIDDAERNGKEILQEPSNWVKDSQTKLQEADHVFQESSGLQPCCWPFNVGDCNCKRRYQVADRAVKLTEEIGKLLNEGKAINEMTVSKRPRRPQRLPANFAHQYRALASMEGYIETLKGWLIGDQKREIVGVYGSKGAGKTLLVKKLAVVLDSNGHDGEVNGVVYVSAGMELKAMQQGIAERVGLVPQNEAVQERGIWLISRLVAIGNVVFIVDDVDVNTINFDLFGIPWSDQDKNGCRFVVVSSSLNICKQRNTHMELEVEPLPKEESLQLFKELGSQKHGEEASNTFQKGIDHISSKSTWLAGDVHNYYNKLYFGSKLPGTELAGTLSVDYQVVNNVASTLGGMVFTTQIGSDYGQQTLDSATNFILDLFQETDPSSRKDIQQITLIIESFPGEVAKTVNNQIHFSSEYLARFQGDVKREFTGVIYHEMTYVWQWNGNGQVYSVNRGGLITGIADFVRLKAGLGGCTWWVQPGQGSRWDKGYDVTARFLDYCDSMKSGFVAQLNAKMRDSYDDRFFSDLLGKPVDQLWSDYKAKYGYNGWFTYF